jgi:hypothetical protein
LNSHFPKSRLAQIERNSDRNNADGKVVINPGEDEEGEEGWKEPEKNEMPKFFADHLKGICKHCECKKEILWRNFNRPEQHFEACFRYFDEQKEAGEEKQEIDGLEANRERETKMKKETTDTSGGGENITNKPLRQNSLGKQEPQNKCFLKRL